MREKNKTLKSGAVMALRTGIASAVLFYAHLALRLQQREIPVPITVEEQIRSS